MPEINSGVRDFLQSEIRQAASKSGRTNHEITDNFDLFESGVFDSLGFIGLVNKIEQEFEIEFDLSEVEPEVFSKFGGLVNIVDQLLGSDSTES